MSKLPLELRRAGIDEGTYQGPEFISTVLIAAGVKGQSDKVHSLVKDHVLRRTIAESCTKREPQWLCLVANPQILGDEGLCSGGTKLNSIFIIAEKTPSKNKEPTHLRRSRRLEDQSTTREKARRERSKSRRKRSGHQETSSDSEYEEGSDDACEDLNSPYKRPKPTLFTQRITHFKYHKRAKLPRNIKVYEGNKDLEDHLGAAQNWFDDLDPKSVDSFKELSQKFLEEFSQQKRYAKDPTEIHGIKRRQNEGLQDFIDRKDTFTPLTKTLKEILTVESVSFPEPPPLIETPEKQNLNKFCDYHGDRGHNTNDCYHLKKQIEEAMASGKLAHLVKDIR
ncbi:reverse transcriptase domain-containing protein [Tanacetum coccineum]|uniref:Reverse transcriptase domain-containing protein n=1 Tax=Tanacetum coccineum TaxID=301880 RepID=A0ABQ5FAZ8_9ASTR